MDSWIENNTEYTVEFVCDEWIAKSFKLNGDLIDETRYSSEPNYQDVMMDLNNDD
jgi:hypothetical protein